MPHDAVPLGKRMLVAFLAALAMGVFVMVSWAFTGFGLAGALRGVKAETVGYTTIVLAPGGASVAFVAALAAGFPPFGRRPWLRWVVMAGVFFALGFVVFGYLARTG